MANEPMQTLIENTTMQKYYNNEGEFLAYKIKPIEGYLLHDKNLDFPEFDEETMEETGVVFKGYSSAERTAWNNYEFTPVEMTDEQGNTVIAYGEREFFAVPANEVPENQTFNTGNNNHEVM